MQETTYYTALANLLDAVGKTLKPRVRCILQLQNRGAGNPDGGLFTPDQFPKGSAEPAGSGLPSRGVIEIKSTSEDSWIVADGEQVTKYWGRYNQVLVTNYRDFVVVGRDADGRQVKLETYRLARAEAEFWKAASNPRETAARVGESFIEFLKRVMLLSVPLDSSDARSWERGHLARIRSGRDARAPRNTDSAGHSISRDSIALRGTEGRRSPDRAFLAFFASSPPAAAGLRFLPIAGQERRFP